jgi:DNA topoisomerase-1
MQELPGQELFQYLDDEGKRQTVDAGDINDYLQRVSGREITAKDFRTWAGTMFAAAELRALGPAANEKEAKANIVRAVDQVARRLGNTRAVCRKYYIHPVVLDSYLEGTTAPAAPPPASQQRERPSGALRREEMAVLEFIQTQLG